MEWMRVVRGYPVIDSAAFQEVVGGPGLADRQTKRDAIDFWLEALRARLAQKLSSDYDAFSRFVRTAHWRDHGEAAAREVYGVGVRTLLER